MQQNGEGFYAGDFWEYSVSMATSDNFSPLLHADTT
jgi:hypothetical protein